MSDRDQEPVGSVSEEAAKLLGALQDWARDNGGDYAHAAAGAAAGAASAAGSLSEHIATGGRDCRYCPICQLISAVRETSPEVRQHLSSAANSLLHAVAAAATGTDPGKQRRAGSPVEKIDLSDEGDWEDD